MLKGFSSIPEFKVLLFAWQLQSSTHKKEDSFNCGEDKKEHIFCRESEQGPGTICATRYRRLRAESCCSASIPKPSDAQHHEVPLFK